MDDKQCKVTELSYCVAVQLLLNVPGLRLLGRGEDGDSEEVRFRDDCCPGIASSASSIIRFCK